MIKSIIENSLWLFIFAAAATILITNIIYKKKEATRLDFILYQVFIGIVLLLSIIIFLISAW